MKCPYCGNEHPDQAIFCPVTGQNLPVAKSGKCPQCQQEIPSGCQFCPYCGFVFNQHKKQSSSGKFYMAILGFGLILILIGTAFYYRDKLEKIFPFQFREKEPKLTFNLTTEQKEILANFNANDFKHLQFSQDGSLFAIVRDNAILIFNAQTFKLLQSIRFAGELVCYGISPDNYAVAVSTSDNVLRLWRISNGYLLGRTRTDNGRITAVSFMNSWKAVAAGYTNGQIIIWRMDTAQQIDRLEIENGEVTCLQLSPDGRLLAACVKGKPVRYWIYRGGKFTTAFTLENRVADKLLFTPHGNYMVLWNEGQTSLLQYQQDFYYQVAKWTCPDMKVTFSARDQYLICACGENLEIWDLVNMEMIAGEQIQDNLIGLSMAPGFNTLLAFQANGLIFDWSDTDLSRLVFQPQPGLEKVEIVGGEPFAEIPDQAGNNELATSAPVQQSQQSQATSQATNLPVATPTMRPTLTPTIALQPFDVVNNAKDLAPLVYVPAGEFLMGSDPATDPYFWGAEAPEHSVDLPDFWIYQTEVTNGMYQQCVAEKACPIPVQDASRTISDYYGNSKYDDYPVIFVTWTHAQSYCRWAGGRLPTEAEWEKAARGTDGRMFPWGNSKPDGTEANLCDKNCPENDKESQINDGYRDVSPVGSFPAGVSPYGALDMAGNVWEWNFDWFQETYYQVSPYENPQGPASGKHRVIRGGGFTKTIGGLRTAVRYAVRPDISLDTLGFRCVVENVNP